MTNAATDQDLEALIDRAGRQAVFARATTYGWSAGSTPPKWVWRGIAYEILAQPPASEAPAPKGRTPLRIAPPV